MEVGRGDLIVCFKFQPINIQGLNYVHLDMELLQLPHHLGSYSFMSMFSILIVCVLCEGWKVSHLWGCVKHIGSFIQFVNLFTFIIFYQSYDFIHCWFFCQHNPPISSVTCSRRTPNPLSSFWVGSVYTEAATTTTTTLTITPERHLQVPALAAAF
jgi:hypothetical protein